MCAKCEVIDIKIAQYRRLSERALDSETLSRLREGLEALEAEKAKLHPPDKMM